MPDRADQVAGRTRVDLVGIVMKALVKKPMLMIENEVEDRIGNRVVAFDCPLIGTIIRRHQFWLSQRLEDVEIARDYQQPPGLRVRVKGEKIWIVILLLAPKRHGPSGVIA